MTQLNSVVFPEPFGPIKPTISPACTAKLTPFTAATPPKCFVNVRRAAKHQPWDAPSR